MAESRPPCRLYLPLPASSPPGLDERFAQVGIDAGPLLICGGGRPIDENRARELLDLAHARDLACLIAGDATLAHRLGADGVHIGAEDSDYLEARQILGKETSIGSACGLSRHKAMHIAEIGADYVAFGEKTDSGIDAVDKCAELIAWWAEIFVVPCVAWNVRSPEDAARFAKLGADFVAPSIEIWRGDDAMTRIAEMDRAIAAGRKAA